MSLAVGISIISILLNIFSVFVIVLLMKKLKEAEKTISVTTENTKILKGYYDKYSGKIESNLKSEEEAANATDKEAESIITGIIEHNNDIARMQNSPKK